MQSVDIDQDQQPPAAPSLPTMADLRGVAADLDDIDEVLARLDDTEDAPDERAETLDGESVDLAVDPYVAIDLGAADDEGSSGQASDFASR